MQFLAIFLLAVSAGALPQSHTLSPSATTPGNSTESNKHEKRFKYPTLGNFDAKDCQGTHLGDKTTLDDDSKCFPFIAPNTYVDIYWGEGSGVLQFYSDDACSNDHLLHTLSQEGLGSRMCVERGKLGDGVHSVNWG